MSKILVIDDNAMNLKMAEFMLTKKNYQVVKATSGREGLEILSSDDHIDLVLLDIEMPEMDGFETLDQIRGSQEMADKKVILLTASMDEEDEKRAAAYHVLDYIKKPFLPQDLQDRVARVLA